ncbi:MAG: chromosome partitioning protein ParB family [Bacillota bacterium]|nr:MAG: chromosome partitioning protein ParB family [Bacillota bacterium]MBS3951301.1 ParB/RepB/Spo0J family partition protein [Peptococcaceae bacterium]
MTKQRLGRGLQALITDMSPSTGDEVQNIGVDALVPNPYQPRRNFTEESLTELAESIRQHGVIQPVIVRQRGDRFELVVGERRLRAARLAGLKVIPVFVRDMSDVELMEVAIIENLQREDLNAIEEATAIKQLQESLGYTQERLAQRLGKSRPYIANSIRLLGLPKAALEYVSRGTLTAGHGRAILAVSENMREALAQRIVDQSLSVRQAEELAQAYGASVSRETRPKKSLPQQSLEIREVERRLQEALQAKVQIRGQGQRGIIEIAYFNSEELERLLEVLARGTR